MKKFLAAFLLLSVLFTFCACNKTNTTETAYTTPENISASADENINPNIAESETVSIGSETLSPESETLSADQEALLTEPEAIPADSVKLEDLFGRWYGPDNTPIIDIHNDGTGTVKVGDNAYKAEFTVEKGVFSVSSEGYEISGKFFYTGSLIEVEVQRGDKSYTVAFLNEATIKPFSSYFYSIGDKKYEYNPDNGTISESSFPLDKNANSKEVYVVMEKAPEGAEFENYLVYRFYEMPPENYGNPDSNTESATDNNVPIPTKLDLCTDNFRVAVDGKFYPASAKLNTITGTWTTDVNENYEYFFGNIGSDDKIEYTFNEDGTGNVRINDTFGYLSYTYENSVIDLSVTIGDKTETNKGQAVRIGDVLYLENADGEAISMSWLNPFEMAEPAASSTVPA